MTDAAIEATDLVRDFKKGPRAVDGIELRVEPGEVFGFLGPNGAGKSTTVHMLTTLLPPTSGSARVAGHDVSARGRRGARADRRRAAGGRARPVPDRRRAHEAPDRAPRHARPRGARALADPARARGPHAGRRPPRGRLLGRHEAPPRPGARARAQAADPLPRRAHHGPRPAEPQRALGGGAAAGLRPRRDGLPHHPVPRGGRRAGRPRGDHRPRPDRGRGHARGAQGRDRPPERGGDPRRARATSSA